MSDEQTTHTATNVQHIAISPDVDGNWCWDVFFDDESLDKGGRAATFDDAIDRVKKAVTHG